MRTNLGMFEPCFQPGNTKMGSIHTWNLPPVLTCPGRSLICMEILADGLPRCYAMREAFRMEQTQRRHRINYQWTHLPMFADWAIASIRRHHHRVIRWNGTGDWYSPDYISMGHRIVRATPETRHYCHTRSHSVPELLPMLVDLASEPNFHMLFSFDHSMSILPQIEGIDLCYLSVGDDDEPPCPVYLVFRDWPRYGEAKTIRTATANGSFVCPYEDGTGRPISCSVCQRCWSRAELGVPSTALGSRRPMRGKESNSLA